MAHGPARIKPRSGSIRGRVGKRTRVPAFTRLPEDQHGHGEGDDGRGRGGESDDQCNLVQTRSRYRGRRLSPAAPVLARVFPRLGSDGALRGSLASFRGCAARLTTCGMRFYSLPCLKATYQPATPCGRDPHGVNSWKLATFTVCAQLFSLRILRPTAPSIPISEPLPVCEERRKGLTREVFLPMVAASSRYIARMTKKGRSAT